jgi:hypothetical protein
MFAAGITAAAGTHAFEAMWVETLTENCSHWNDDRDASPELAEEQRVVHMLDRVTRSIYSDNGVERTS